MAYPNYMYPQQYQQPMYANPQMAQAQMSQPQMQPQMQAQLQPQMQMPQQVPQQIPQQMQNGGFVAVRSEQEARNYPVAPGNVMTFKIENQPIVCEKSQGFSQLEGPVFNKYRLVKEDEATEETVTEAPVQDTLREELEELKREVKALKEKIYSKPKNPNRDNHDNKGGHKE